MKPLPDMLEADAMIEECLRLANKAMLDGKFEKATAYALCAIAWQNERTRAEARLEQGL